MKILIINANKDHRHNFLTKIAYKINSGPILVLQQLAAATPRNHDVKLIDDRYDTTNYDADVDLVGISILTPSAPRAYNIADEFRKRGKTVVLGGYHPSALPKEAKQHADSVVIGEAESTWTQLLKDFENRNLESFYNTDLPVDPAAIPEPRNELLRIRPFISPVLTSRGCPYHCSFCSLSHLYGSDYRPRPIKNIIQEIERIDRRFLYLCIDASLTIDIDYSKALFRAMIPLKKKFIAYGSAPPLLKDDDLLKLSKEAGCINWSIGFETICQKSLTKDANKAYNVKDYADIVKKIHEYDMNVFGTFVFGFDHDTPDIFDNTLNAVYDLGLDSAEFDILTPFPITRLFHQLEKEGRILTYDWTKYDFHHVVFKPKNMTPKELFDGTAKVAKDFSSPIKSIQRIMDVAINTKALSNILAAISFNFLYVRFHREYQLIKQGKL